MLSPAGIEGNKLRDAFECALRMRRHPKTKPAD